MDLKKGLTYVARGCFFILFDFTLDITDKYLSIDFLPDFIGWIMIFMAVDCLGKFVGNNSFIKWTAIAMVAMSILEWYTGPDDKNAEFTAFYTLIDVISTACLYSVFSAAELIAKDFELPRESNIRRIKGWLIVWLVVNTAYGVIYEAFPTISTILLIPILIGALVFPFIVASNMRKLRDEVVPKLGNT